MPVDEVLPRGLAYRPRRHPAASSRICKEHKVKVFTLHRRLRISFVEEKSSSRTRTNTSIQFFITYAHTYTYLFLRSFGVIGAIRAAQISTQKNRCCSLRNSKRQGQRRAPNECWEVTGGICGSDARFTSDECPFCIMRRSSRRHEPLTRKFAREESAGGELDATFTRSHEFFGERGENFAWTHWGSGEVKKPVRSGNYRSNWLDFNTVNLFLRHQVNWFGDYYCGLWAKVDLETLFGMKILRFGRTINTQNKF